MLDGWIPYQKAPGLYARVNDALKEKDITCIGVNDKGNGRYRLIFENDDDVNVVRRDDSWLNVHLPKARLYGEQWYPVRLDRVHRDAPIDEEGCELFGSLHGVKVHKMRWVVVFKSPVATVVSEIHDGGEYRSVGAYLDNPAEAQQLIEKRCIEATRGESVFVHPWKTERQPVRCYRCHHYGHLHYRCKAPTSFCGQCSQPGHSASVCTSTTFRCISCKGPHKSTDSGCPVYRREKEKLSSSTSY